MSSETRRSRSRAGRAPLTPARPADPISRYATVPLRFFLGITFLYAGLQKLFDPGYFTPGSDSYIGSQLQSFATISPIGFLFQWFALPIVPLFGAVVIAVEVAVGLLIVVGLWTRGAAVVAAVVSVLLFLSATWDVQPYFLGSDSIYAVALVTLSLVGDGGILSLQAWWRGRAPTSSRYPSTSVRPFVDKVDSGRRVFLLGVGGATVTIIWLLGILPRTQRAAASQPVSDPTSGGMTGSVADPFAATMPTLVVAAAIPSPSVTLTDTPAVATVTPLVTTAADSPTPSPAADRQATATTPALISSAATASQTPRAVAPTIAPVATATTVPTATTVRAVAPVGTPIGTLAQLKQAGGSLSYQDPASGDPAVVVGLTPNTLAAFDAVCPHAGCAVIYSAGQRLLVCPCHGAEFDPTKAGAVVRGPARRPLSPLTVNVGPDGKIYAIG